VKLTLEGIGVRLRSDGVLVPLPPPPRRSVEGVVVGVPLVGMGGVALVLRGGRGDEVVVGCCGLG